MSLVDDMGDDETQNVYAVIEIDETVAKPMYLIQELDISKMANTGSVLRSVKGDTIPVTSNEITACKHKQNTFQS